MKLKAALPARLRSNFKYGGHQDSNSNFTRLKVWHSPCLGCEFAYYSVPKWLIALLNALIISTPRPDLEDRKTLAQTLQLCRQTQPCDPVLFAEIKGD